ncbi:MAG: DUF418 domain-containing protein [Gammaproteobacteria bacterium]
MSKQRIHNIDAIRGFAVFGILLANIQSWSGYRFLPYTFIDKLGYEEYDLPLFQLNMLLVDSKFYAIFSILFGVGFGLQWLKKQESATTFLPIYRRRMLFLLLFGVCHALIWSGDILTLYALLAFVVIALRNLSDAQTLRLALFMLGAFLITQLIHMGLFPPAEKELRTADVIYSDMSWDRVIGGLGSEDLGEIFTTNLHNLYYRWAAFIPNGRVTRVLGFMLLGVYLARCGFFTSTALKPRSIVVFLLPGLVLTVLAISIPVSMSSWATNVTDLLAKFSYVCGQTLMALGYMCIICQLFNRPFGQRLLHPLTLIGRTAFTSYLSQTFIGIAIFYGIGMNQVAEYSLLELWILAIIIYSCQVLFSSVWLRFFKQGPIEWLWRCLTVKQWMPNRI